MPASQVGSQAPSNKQASISSFFSPKPTANNQRPAVSPNVAKANGSASVSVDALQTENSYSNGLKRSVDGDRGLPSPKRQRTLVSESSTGEREALAERATPNGNVAPPVLKRQGTQITDRTRRFLFSSTQDETAAGVEEDFAELDNEEAQERRHKLHQKFVKKLGRPDSIAEIKRRNHLLGEDNPAGEDDADGQDEPDEEAPKSTARGKKGPTLKKGGKTLTPMEKQMLEIKRKHMDTLLIVEVGYKYRFFGEDARIAAKELSIFCIPGKFRYDEHPSEAHLDKFASASVPVHRLHVHVKRLVAAGHKVGVVRQLETAALKAVGDNRNTPFVRKLTNVYTKGTYIDDIDGLETDGPSGGAPATGHLLCMTESNAAFGWGTDEKVHVGFVAVQPSTGDIIYDDFEDGFMRSEIETRLLHISPCEFLIVGETSKATEKLIQHLSGSKMNVFGERVRVERAEKPKNMAAKAFEHITDFYAKIKKSTIEQQSQSDELPDHDADVYDKIRKLPEHVMICLSAMITHLTEYGLEHVFDLTKNFQSFSARSHMLLNGNTLTSLEIYRNQTDNTEKGSLFWILDRTQTRFGQRLLRKWVGRPLLDKGTLEQRVDAVDELKTSERTISFDKLKHLLATVRSDLEKSLIRIYYKKCTRAELLIFLQTLQKIAQEYAQVKKPADSGFRSEMLNEAIASLPNILPDVVAVLEKINAQAAKANDKYGFFREEVETDDMVNHRLGIVAIESDLDAFRKEAADKLRKKKVDYVTVAGIDYLIEIEKHYVKNVPASWTKISSTKAVDRFHAPQVVKLVQERDQHKEALAAACDEAYMVLLADLATKYQSFRDCIQSLALLDCLLSLAEVASQPGYVKPTFTAETRIRVKDGRHPMVEQLLLDAYVPNDISLSTSERAMLITGPNMGGKSSYVRQVALICIMGQIGSYVPATEAELGMLDAVFTRMGAFDNMMAGESTFMVELSETSDILKQATPRSLIVLDELGRGTSTHDGVAIAHAVLDYLVRESKALLLFITHYQHLAQVAGGFRGNQLRNVHMKFTEEDMDDAAEADAAEAGDITFLYELGDGVAHRSYGLNVARLANVPKEVIDVASIQSRQMEMQVQQSRLASMSRALLEVAEGKAAELDFLVEGIEQL
ncbi:hypothetical protein MRB53_037684 [Persea americana]|nr:hypothetical protein MRB53_037684 [Persea americana]